MKNSWWVIFELPGFISAASGTAQPSLAVLRSPTDTSYYKDALWVMVVSSGDVESAVRSRSTPHNGR